MEEKEAVGMSYCEVGLGGLERERRRLLYVGGWVGGTDLGCWG